MDSTSKMYAIGAALVIAAFSVLSTFIFGAWK
jgi:hypothetical protein